MVATLLVAVGAGQWHRQEALRTPDGRHWNLTQAADYLLAHARPDEGIGYLPGHLQYVADLYPRVGHELHQFQIAVSPSRWGPSTGSCATAGTSRRRWGGTAASGWCGRAAPPGTLR